MSKKVGSKLEVFNGTAEKTSGGLKIGDLMKNKKGKVVSKKQHAAGLKAFANNNLSPLSAEELRNLRKKK